MALVIPEITFTYALSHAEKYLSKLKITCFCFLGGF
jgi:hypothetical protein